MKIIQRFLTVGLFMAIALLTLLEPAFAGEGKVYVLLVWGSKATDTAEIVKASQKIFETKIADVGIRPKYPGESDNQYAAYCMTASFTSLSGDAAHPEKILEHCKRMAQEAGENDCLFVYILCHEASIYLDGHNGDPDYLIHILSPVAADGTDDGLDLRNIGIKRYSILQAMKSRKHRLDVLITDSCSGLSPYPVKPSIVHCLCGSRLSYLLNYASGTINWNSSDPRGGYERTGECAIGTPTGTFFTKAFLETACDEDRSGDSPDLFYNDLKARLIEIFKKEERKVRQSLNDEILVYSGQDQQTVTKFDEYGRPLKN